nr:ATP-binding cassette domain-containing protein [Microbacterium excoecariae]
MTVTNARRSFGTRRRAHLALDGVDLDVTPGARIGIVGESGSGKSTLSRMLVGLDTPDTGDVSFDGRPVRSWLSDRRDLLEFRRAVQYIPQDTTSSFDPRRTLRDSVRMPALTLLGLTTREADERVDEMVASLGLAPDMADRRPGHVSGGQRQRFAIARALIVEPQVVVCDEVVSALDVSVQGVILNLLKEYVLGRQAALVFVSHGLPATAFISSDMVVMRGGRILERGTTHRVVEHAEDPYTQGLLSAYALAGGTA